MRYKLLAVSAVVMTAMFGCTEETIKKDVVETVAPTHIASGEMLGNTCSGCHGPKGNSFGPGIPSIAGISEEFFIDRMGEYKDGSFPSTIMANIAKGYSEAEIEAMATFYAEQEYIPRVQKHDAKLAANGKKLHKKYCQKCHDNDPDDESGFLTGQWMAYLEYTLADYHSGSAKASKKMSKKLKALYKDHGATGITSLINYYGSAK